MLIPDRLELFAKLNFHLTVHFQSFLQVFLPLTFMKINIFDYETPSLCWHQNRISSRLFALNEMCTNYPRSDSLLREYNSLSGGAIIHSLKTLKVITTCPLYKLFFVRVY